MFSVNEYEEKLLITVKSNELCIVPIIKFSCDPKGGIK